MKHAEGKQNWLERWWLEYAYTKYARLPLDCVSYSVSMWKLSGDSFWLIRFCAFLSLFCPIFLTLRGRYPLPIELSCHVGLMEEYSLPKGVSQTQQAARM